MTNELKGGAQAHTQSQPQSQAEMLFNRLQKRQRHLRKWAARIGAEAYRLYDRDIPEIPLALDWYKDAAVGALYRRPYEKDEAEEERWLLLMKEAAAEALKIEQGRLFFKERKPQRLNNQYQKIADKSFVRDIREGGHLFRVNLSDYLDTGLFPDRRKMRALIGAEAAGKRVLNLFCYTASFSVYAASGGTAGVDSVDMSRTYLDWAAVNFGLNHLDARIVEGRDFFAELRRAEYAGPQNRLIHAEALSFLESAARAGLRWDIIILDPPSFSNSKKMTGTLDIKRDYQNLISRCLYLLEKNGTLWFSANARHFKLNNDDFPGFTLRELDTEITDEDFRGRKIPRCYTFRYGD
ncbi:rRNA (guanine-N2)-methyltransferase [Spirochaetia bacterium]|nr:rRNA (guanine-N2)-methyltransferase [Spirochaetia bacterium]